MGRGRHTALRITLTEQDQQTLQAWQRSTTLPAAQARRGRAILLLADGMPILHIAHRIGQSRRFVYKWITRFVLMGVDGLKDKPGRGWRQKRCQQAIPLPRNPL